MSRRPLITVFEVIDKAPVQHNLDPKLIQSFLIDAESLLCRNDCFGEEFYLDLLNELRPADEYDDCRAYQTGDDVIFGSRYYCAIQDSPGGINPTDSTTWDEVTKFLNPDYDELWCNFLCDYMTFSVLHAMLINNAYQISTAGVQQMSTQFSEHAGDKGLLLLKNDLQNKKETRYLMMHQFLTRKTDTVDNVSKYPLYPPNKNANCGDECGKKRKSSINIPLKHHRKHHFTHRHRDNGQYHTHHD